MIFDPNKQYAELKKGTNVVLRAPIQGSELIVMPARLRPRWRRFVEIPTGQSVSVGDVWNGSSFGPRPPATVIDRSNIDQLEKAARAIALLIRKYGNEVHAEVRGLALLLVNKGVITAAEANSLTQYVGSGPAGTKTIAELKADFKTIFDALNGG